MRAPELYIYESKLMHASMFITVAHEDGDDGTDNGARHGVLVLSAMAIPTLLILFSHGFYAYTSRCSSTSEAATLPVHLYYD